MNEEQAVARRKPASLCLQPRKAPFAVDGGSRTVSPAETLARYAHHVSPFTGVVHSLKRLSEASSDNVHVYIARFPRASMKEGEVGGCAYRTSMGKGRTAVQAQVSALCEALERVSACYRGDEVQRIDTYQTLGDEAIHPNRCMLFSDAQYQHQKTDPYLRSPAPFEEDREIAWTPLWSLTHETVKYLPTVHCYFDYQGPGAAYGYGDYNGNAAGNTLEEAILQGFMELVERDAVALWWYNRIRRPAVDLDSFDDPYFPSLLQYYHRVERDFWVIDITTDLEIPAFVALSGSRASPQEPLLYGFGAHFDARLALSRAVTEMNQALPVILTMRAEGRPFSNQGDAVSMSQWPTARLDEQAYLRPSTRWPAKKASDYPDYQHDHLLDDVMRCAGIVKSKGMEMLVLDQTRSDIGLPVVKVMVPGLRPHWKRLAPGRLYDVPVALAWLPAPLERTGHESASGNQMMSLGSTRRVGVLQWMLLDKFDIVGKVV